MNVLIVDDEYAIREGLREMLERLVLSRTTIRRVITAIDGNSALAALHRQDFDLLITDVRMPGMDGLRLLEQARNRYPRLKTIMLSGYDDFSYVRDALRLGAVDYLLKPVQLQELTAAIERIRTEDSPEDEARSSWGRFKDIDGFKALAVVDLDRPLDPRAGEFGDLQTLAWLLNKTASEIMEERQCAVIVGELPERGDVCNLVCGFVGESADKAEQLAERFAESLSGFWSDVVRLTVSVGISRPFGPGQAEDVPYSEALLALLMRLGRGSGIYRAADVGAEAAAAKTDPRVWQQLQATLDVGDFDRLTERLRGLIRECSDRGTPLQLIRTIEKLLLALQSRVQDDLPAADQARHTAEFIRKLCWARDEDVLFHGLSERINGLYLQLDPEEREGQIMAKAKKYMREHLGEPLTLEDVSRLTYVSRSHLSRLFRKRAGQTFLEYLTDLRIEEARRLLSEPGIKIYELAERLGYRDWKHFSRTFKDRTGYGPADYRANLSVKPSE